MKRLIALVIALTLALSGCGSPVSTPSGTVESGGEKKVLTIWSHWSDEESKKQWVQTAVDNFLAKNPDFEVEINWQQNSDLTTALNAALPAGEGPDIFYLEPVITGAFPNFYDAGYMMDLTPYLEGKISDGALEFATRNGEIYLLPVEAYSPLLYVNESIMEQAGVETGALSMDSEALFEALEKIQAAGYKGLAAGTMDRTWCASIMTDVVLLRCAGLEKWQGLRDGSTSWTDPDVRRGLEYMDRLVKAGFFPEGVGSIKLGESHGIFFSGEYGMFPMKTFFSGRAFVPVESGGMPESLADTNLANTNPGWVKTVDGGLYLDPANPDVRAYIAAGVGELCRNYDIDGVHFDDYFYPATDPAFDEEDYAAYCDGGGTLALADWRRQNVDELVALCYETAHGYGVRFGIAPQGDPDSNYQNQYSDAARWLAEEGFVDYLMPQLYWGLDYTKSGDTSHSLTELAGCWLKMERREDVALYFGLGAYRIGEGDGGDVSGPGTEWQSGGALAAQADALAELGGQGIGLYRYDSLFNNTLWPTLAAQEVEALRGR